MSLFRYLSTCSALALAAGVVSAAPPRHPGGGAHPGGAHMGAPHVAAGGAYHPHYATPYYGSRNIGIGIGSGLYGPLGYGLGYSPFGYSGLGYNYGAYGSGPLGYGYPSGFRGSNYGNYSSIGVPAVPGTYYPSSPSYQLPQAQPQDPTPLPLPAPAGDPAPATIIVIASEGATVSFDGLPPEPAGTRHSFTTRPLAPGAETRVSVKVDGPGGASTISIGVRAGEKATVDMRK